jgi:multiple sugar transport system permease protein
MSRFKIFILNFVLFSGALIMIAPLIWMLILSLKTNPESISNFFKLLFSDYTISNYQSAFENNNFLIFFANSIFVGLAVTLGNILFCFTVGYALARRSFLGKNVIFFSILAVMIIPPHLIMIPLYRLMVTFGWMNSYFSLIVPWLITPFGIFLVKQFIESIPEEIENAAKIDGAGSWYILFRIVMPLAKPVLTVLAIYTFLNTWNSFLFPFLFTNEESIRTLPVHLAFFIGKQSIDLGNLMAGASISAIPILIIFMFFQKNIIKGLTAGALKE